MGDTLTPAMMRFLRNNSMYRKWLTYIRPRNRNAGLCHYNMSRARSKDTKPELIVRKFLHAHGFRYKLHEKKLLGKPDVVLPKYKTVIFIHGCFYHGHEGCRYFVVPKTRTDWWLDKINGNKHRDANNEAKSIVEG